MTRYLRSVRRARWSRPCWNVGTAPAWQGDALGDLNTTKNVLSVYLADTDQKVGQVVAGIAANRDHLVNLDYAFISEDILSKFNLRSVQVGGKTFHHIANELHFDIVDLTAGNVFALMKCLTADNVIRVSKPQVRELLQHSIQEGHIDIANLKPSLVSSLE